MEMMDKDGKKIRVEFPSQENIKTLKPFVDQFLSAIGTETAWVSDRSRVDDFRALRDYHVKLETARSLLNIEICEEDYLTDIAKRLRDKQDPSAHQGTK